jgi:hypothetical protein
MESQKAEAVELADQMAAEIEQLSTIVTARGKRDRLR